MAKIRESRRKAEARNQKEFSESELGSRKNRSISAFEEAAIRRIHSKEFRSKGHNLQREFAGAGAEF